MSLLDELAGEAVVGKVSALVHRGQALILLDDMVWKVSACAQCHWVLHAVLQAVQRMHPCPCAQAGSCSSAPILGLLLVELTLEGAPLVSKSDTWREQGKEGRGKERNLIRWLYLPTRAAEWIETGARNKTSPIQKTRASQTSSFIAS
eukprot:1158046-Pelagomonas_calceolata.AAC.2